MKFVSGDLVELARSGQFDVIIHGCNCQNTMGAGIAKAIAAAFPAALAADRATRRGDEKKLGTITTATITARNGRAVVIVNAYSQLQWLGRGVKVDYHALRAAMATVAGRFDGLRIAYPRIGAGLAGGDWTRIAQIIDEELAGQDHTLVTLPSR